MTKVRVNNTDYSDDGTAPNDMPNGGWRKHLLRMISDLLVEISHFLEVMAAQVGVAADHSDDALHQAQAAAASAATALSAPGTNGTSSSDLMVGLGVKTFVMQPGKEIRKGAQLMVAATTSPRDWMAGTVEQYDSVTGATDLWATNMGQKTPGVFLQASAWTISLTGAPGGSGVVNELKGDTIASAATIDLDAVTGNLIHISGVAQISAATLLAGRRRTLIFDGITRLVHSAAFQLPGGLDVITAPGDMVVVYGDGGNKVLLNNYTKATGAANMSSGILAKSGDVAAGASVDMLTHQALQLLTPLGMGASLKLAPANQLVPAIAAAFASNRSSTYHLGVRNNVGVLLAALQPKTDLSLTLTDATTAAGGWTWGTPVGGVDVGLLLTQEMPLPGAGGQLKSYVMNQPSCVVNIGPTVGGYAQFLTFLSETLAVAIMYSSATTSWSLVAVNPKTGVVSPPLVVSTSAGDDAFRIEPLSATSFAVLWIANASVAGTTSCRIATVNTATMLMGFNGSAVSGASGTDSRQELNTLRLSSGVIVAIQARRSSEVAEITAFVVSGSNITAAGTLVSNGLQQYCEVAYSSIHEIAPSVFAVPNIKQLGGGYISTFSVNVATGALSLVTSFLWTYTPWFGSGAGVATMVNFPGTNYWMVAGNGDRSPNGVVTAHLVNITAAGVVSFVGSATGFDAIEAGFSVGSGTNRFTLQAYGPGQIIAAHAPSSTSISYRAFGYNAATGKLTKLGDSSQMTSSIEFANHAPGSYYVSQSSSGVVKVTWNGIAFNQTALPMPSTSTRFQFGARVGASVVGMFAGVAVDFRSNGRVSLADMASNAGVSVRPNQVTSAGALVVVSNATNNIISTYEVAQ